MGETKEYPILFSGPMVQAILDGKKTQTRRVIKPQPTQTDFDMAQQPELLPKSRFGKVGDHIWLREAWAAPAHYDNVPPRDIPHNKIVEYGEYLIALGGKNRPSIHMPRWASRILLERTEARMERLNDITIEDICAEGVEIVKPGHSITADVNLQHQLYHAAWNRLWDSINAKRGYGTACNPWVDVIGFKVIEGAK